MVGRGRGKGVKGGAARTSMQSLHGSKDYSRKRISPIERMQSNGSENYCEPNSRKKISFMKRMSLVDEDETQPPDDWEENERVDENLPTTGNKGGKRVVVFKCDWWDVLHYGTGYRIDSYGFTSFNINRKLKTTEPFVLASQVEQVYYVQEPKDPNWFIVLKAPPRDLYNIPIVDIDDMVDVIEDNEEVYQQGECDESCLLQRDLNDESRISRLQRDGMTEEIFPCEVAREIEVIMKSTTPIEEFIDDDDNDVELNMDCNEKCDNVDDIIDDE